jgi:phosphoribosylamine--glycine ligase
MNILLVGNGGREHAIARKLLESPQLDRLYVAPGNGGTATLPRSENVEIPADETAALVEFARSHAIDLVIVGPEAPLVAGLADALIDAGVKVFGPVAAAAQLEGSKAFAKEFLLRHRIPTGAAHIFQDYDEAIRHLRMLDAPPVIKASGLAAGKGVLLPASMVEAAEVVAQLLLEKRFGAASETILIEERLSGPEVSVLAFTDGKSVRVMPPAQDHKRLLNKDLGPNTGGMGAFAPSVLLSPEQLRAVEETILLPTIAGIAAEGAPYVGVLYAGLMLTKNGPQVLEFNCRFGDPETQVLLPLLEGDLLEICLACVEGRLAETPVRWRRQSAVTVVMASLNYPNTYPTGMEIAGVDKAEATGCLVYHAGTKVHNGKLYTSGGRVFAITSLGRTVEQASHLAYDGLANIQFNGMQYRQDIGRPLPPQRAKRGRPPVSPVSGVGRSGQSWKSSGRHMDSPLNRPPQPDRSSKGRNNRGGNQGRRGG